MKTVFRFAWRVARAALALGGAAALLFAATLFTNLPWRAYRALSRVPAPATGAPSHILVMGGSGIPGESGLCRTFYGAEAARLHRRAQVLIALPLGTNESFASRAYVGELHLRGVAARRIRVLAGGRNTREQALRLAEWLATNPPPHRVMIVTDPEHVRRTAATLRRVCADRNISVELSAMAAHPLALEDPLPWRAAELSTDAPTAAPRRTVPDIGGTIQLRYTIWNNLNYSQRAFREYAGLLYYRLQGWL